MTLSVVLVNYNDRNHVLECLSSIEKTAGSLDYEIIVVDNNSQDGSPAEIVRRFPRIKLVSNSRNVGFAKANNQGWLGSRGEFILFLNTDTVVEPGALSQLLGELKSNLEAGAVGPALFSGVRSYQVSFGRRVSFCSQLWQKSVLNPFHKIALRTSRRKRKVGWLSAACLLIRRDALQRAEGFDENFFIYFEDIDLCLRIRQAGSKLVYLPQARVLHWGGASTSVDLAASKYEYRKSQVYFYRKHNSKAAQSLLRLYLKLNVQILAWRGCFRGESGKRLREQYAWLLKSRAGVL